MNLEDRLRAVLRSEAQEELPADFVPMVVARLTVRGQPKYGSVRAAGLAGLAAVLLVALAVGSWLVQSWPGRSSFGDTNLNEPMPTPISSPASASPAPSPTPPPSVAGLPSPPESFDPTAIPWIGDAAWGTTAGNYENGIAIGAIDGSGYRKLAEGHGSFGTILADGRALYVRSRQDTYGSELILLDPNRKPVLLALISVPYAVAAEEAVVYAGRVQTEGPDAGREGGLWRIPLDGSPESLVLPPTGGWDDHASIVVSPDGASVVLGRCNDERTECYMEGRLDGGPTQVLSEGRAIGVDVRHGLVFRGAGGILRLERASAPPTLVAEFAADLPLQARVNAEGTHLLTWLAIEGGRDQELLAIDLRDLTQRSWRLDGIWVLTSLGGSRYAVLEGVPTGETSPGWHAIIDLEEGWLGFLPPIRPPGD